MLIFKKILLKIKSRIIPMLLILIQLVMLMLLTVLLMK